MTVVQMPIKNPWVVVCRYEYDAIDQRVGPLHCTTNVEIFRGHHRECVRIANCFGGGENDRLRTQDWSVSIGPAPDWDLLLEDL